MSFFQVEECRHFLSRGLVPLMQHGYVTSNSLIKKFKEKKQGINLIFHQKKKKIFFFFFDRVIILTYLETLHNAKTRF